MNRATQMPERDLERALGALLKVDAAAGRLSRDPWDAIAPRLGSQRSKRPWEYVMDALNKTRMPFKPQYIYTAGGALIVVLAVLLAVLLLNTDDGSSGESVPAAPSDQSAPDVGSKLAGGTLPLLTFAEGFAVDPGSEEAEIVSLTERAIFNLRVRDAEAFRADCHPDLQASVPVAQIATYMEVDSSYPGYLEPVYTNDMNFVVHDIRRFRDTATVTYDWREGSSVITANASQVVEKVDGAWYMTQYVCVATD